MQCPSEGARLNLWASRQSRFSIPIYFSLPKSKFSFEISGSQCQPFIGADKREHVLCIKCLNVRRCCRSPWCYTQLCKSWVIFVNSHVKVVNLTLRWQRSEVRFNIIPFQPDLIFLKTNKLHRPASRTETENIFPSWNENRDRQTACKHELIFYQSGGLAAAGSITRVTLYLEAASSDVSNLKMQLWSLDSLPILSSMLSLTCFNLAAIRSDGRTRTTQMKPHVTLFPSSLGLGRQWHYRPAATWAVKMGLMLYLTSETSVTYLCIWMLFSFQHANKETNSQHIALCFYLRRSYAGQ